VRKLSPILILSLVSLTGCAESYSVYVNGFAETKSRIPPNAHIFVAVEPNAANPIFENEVRTKIETMLRDRGYQVVNTVAAAEYRLTFQLGLVPREETYFEPMDSYFGYGYYREYRGYVPRFETVWDQWLQIKVYRGDTVVWVGEAVTTESYPDKRKAVDYLVVAAFEYFGQDTGSRKLLTIDAKDPRIIGLSSYAK
jgi:hypothetical protein